jgi:hypothetical protein
LKKHKGDGSLIYSNFGIFNPLSDDFYTKTYPQGSLLLIDEIGIVFDNRNYKQFPSACRDFFKYQRKKKLHIVCTSQTLDFDKKLRVLCDELFLLKRILCYSLVLQYSQKIALKSNPQTGGDDLCDTLIKNGLFKEIIFMPSWFSKFDTLAEISFNNQQPNDIPALCTDLCIESDTLTETSDIEPLDTPEGHTADTHGGLLYFFKRFLRRKNS